MPYNSVQAFKIIHKILDECERPQAVLRVWTALQFDCGPGQSIEYDRAQLAKRASVSVWDVSRAISELEKIKALKRKNDEEERAIKPKHKKPERVQKSRGPISVIMLRFW